MEHVKDDKKIEDQNHYFFNKKSDANKKDENGWIRRNDERKTTFI